MWDYQYSMDPQEMACRFAMQDGMNFLASIFEGLADDNKDKMDRVSGLMDRLPRVEADFLDLYFFKGWKQTDIASIFGVRQPTVHYRLQRAALRLKYMYDMPEYVPEEMEAHLRDLLGDEFNVQVMLLMLETTCQTEVAKRLDVTQGKVRHRFFTSLKKLRDVGYPHVDVFDHVSSHLNYMKELRQDATRYPCVIM